MVPKITNVAVEISNPVSQKKKPTYDVAKRAGGFPIRISHTSL